MQWAGVCIPACNGAWGVVNTPQVDTTQPPSRQTLLPWADTYPHLQPPETATELGGTHPTGMHSYFLLYKLGT